MNESLAKTDNNISLNYQGYDSIEELINAAIKHEKVDTNLISDGYHTFGELYDHRIALFIQLAKQLHYTTKKSVWKSKAHSDGEIWEGWFILGINTKPGEQITYHLPINKWAQCAFAQTLSSAPEFDGHTSVDVLNRINSL